MNADYSLKVSPFSSTAEESTPNVQPDPLISCFNPFAAFSGVDKPVYSVAKTILQDFPQVQHQNPSQFLKSFFINKNNQGRFADFPELINAILSQKENPFATTDVLATEWKSLEVEFLDGLTDAKTISSFLELKREVLLSSNNPFQVFQNKETRLMATLDALTSNFGYQARMPECAHDIAPADFDVDKDLKEVLEKNEGTGAYKINSQKNLEQLLTKVPAAFISAGLNPEQVKQLQDIEQALQTNLPVDKVTSLQERLKELIKIQNDNYLQLKDELTNGFKIIEVDGKYGGEEKSFMVILDHKLKVGSFKAFLKNDMVERLIALGKNYHQDSVLFQWGAAQFYYYPDTDKISFGEGYEVYDLCTKEDEDNLPDSAKDYYSDIKKGEYKKLYFQLQLDYEQKLRFQLHLDFEHKFSPNLFGILCDYARTQFFKDYDLGQATNPVHTVPTHQNKLRTIVIMRGVDNYNESGKQLYNELKKQNISAAIFGSDANIHALEREGVKGFSNILPQMRIRNKNAFDALLNNTESDVIIYADMNKKVDYFEPYIDDAVQAGIDNILIWNVQERNMANPLQRCLFSHTVRHKMEIEHLKSTEVTKHNIPQIIDTGDNDNLPLILKNITAKYDNHKREKGHGLKKG